MVSGHALTVVPDNSTEEQSSLRATVASALAQASFAGPTNN